MSQAYSETGAGAEPSPSMSDEEFEERAVLHALGVLSPPDRARFEAERAARGPQGERIVRSARRAIARAGVGPGSNAGPAEREALAAVTDRPLARETPKGWLAAVVALALVLAGALVWGYRQRERAEALGAERQAALFRADSLDSRLASSDSAAALRPRVDELLPVLSAPGLASFALRGDGGASARLLVDDEGGLFAARNLLALEPGLAYHLWTQTDAGFERIAPLGRATEGRVFALLPDARVPEGWGAVLVTVEPEGGSPVPTGATVLVYRGRLR